MGLHLLLGQMGPPAAPLAASHPHRRPHFWISIVVPVEEVSGSIKATLTSILDGPLQSLMLSLGGGIASRVAPHRGEASCTQQQQQQQEASHSHP